MDCVMVALSNRGMIEAARQMGRVESPGAYVTERFSGGNFCLALCSLGPPSRALVVITWRVMGCRHIWDKL